MAVMKSFLAIVPVVIGISIACSAYKSAGSQPATNNGADLGQSSAQTNNTSTQNSPPCSLTMDQTPVINGLRLGMTAEQVLALFPGSSEDVQLRDSLSRPPSQLGVS